MTTPMPPPLDGAFAQLNEAITSVEKKSIDLLKAPWAEVEKSVIKLLGGPFRPDQPAHQFIALGLAAAFGGRLAEEHKAFWFPSRESPEGAALGFPEALIMLSPFGAVLEALGTSKLERLDEIAKDIRTSLAQVKFSAGAGAPMRLTAVDYQRLFDPGFVQLVALDKNKAETAWKTPPDRLAYDIRDALGRLGTKLPEQLKKQLDGQLVTALQRLEPGKPLIDQVARAPRLVELIGHLFGTTANSGSAPEEFWQDFAFPLAFIGSPEKFPELGEEELALAKQGIDPLFLFLEVVPFSSPAPEDDGLMGAFPTASLALPHPALEAAGSSLRMVKVGVEAIKGPMEKFDAAKTQAALARFTEGLKAKLGAAAPGTQPQAKEMLDAALALLGDAKKVILSGQDVCVRRLTEAEASAELALAQVRQALQGPRIILA